MDLLGALLTYDPGQRPSAKQALQHAYFAQVSHTARPLANRALAVEPACACAGQQACTHANALQLQNQ